MIVAESARRLLRISRKSTVRKSRNDEGVMTGTSMEMLQEWAEFEQNWFSFLATCKDKLSHCKELKKAGVCETSKDAMVVHCPSTCKFCGKCNLALSWESGMESTRPADVTS